MPGYCKTAAEFHACLLSAFTAYSRNDAVTLAEIATNALQDEFQGIALYINKPNKKERNQRIKAAFTGCNHKELAAANNLSNRMIRKILDAK